MSGLFAASLFSRRAPLALGLCLLAFLFAIEAKTAWYGPAVGFGSSVRAAKAQPEATPRVVEHGVPVPDPARPHLAFIPLQPTAVASFAHFPLQTCGAVLLGHLAHFPAPGFSFSSFIRPPPAF